MEIDKHARSVLAKQFPNTQLFNDVREVTGNDLQRAGFIPERGIITGGFPCQDLSVAGKRAGLAGARSGLFYEIARLADETKAHWLCLENVPGLLSSNNGNDMGAVIGTLVELGYGVAWRVLDAQHFGVPQRRRRIFIVAERSGNPAGCAEVLFKRKSVRGNNPQSGTPRQDFATSSRQGPTYPSVIDGLEAFNEYRGVISIQGSVVGRSDTAGPGGKGYGDENDPMFTLNVTDRHAVVEPTVYEPHHGDGRSTTGVVNTLAARMGTGGNTVPVVIEGTNVVHKND